jgi:hypothetical protein
MDIVELISRERAEKSAFDGEAASQHHAVAAKRKRSQLLLKRLSFSKCRLHCWAGLHTVEPKKRRS